MSRIRQLAAALLCWAVTMTSALAQSITLASTTSTEQSGLFGHLVPLFKRATGIDVKVVALGTGQALDLGRRGDADLLLVHDPSAEEKFVADGFGLQRHAVMSNDYVIVGPRSDPARAKGHDLSTAMKQLAASSASFVSRGDKSGTHAAELRYWALAGPGYRGSSGVRECGCGMGQALNMAASGNAYALTDRGTWLGFKNRGELVVLVEGDQRMFNPYSVIAVNPAKHPHVKATEVQKLVDWLLSSAGRSAIAEYKIGGEQLFFPVAR